MMLISAQESPLKLDLANNEIVCWNKAAFPYSGPISLSLSMVLVFGDQRRVDSEGADGFWAVSWPVTIEGMHDG